ncbi:hypothetical protein [Saccharopolyspora sp. CA-218241]|uniref:hypothetical protein n=1 Tax=Saccharopolyspora sp. CA-218241 TaxID=3240027 RepID=UPI003D95F6CA
MVARLFSPEWARRAREVADAGADESLRATKLASYWEWIDRVRAEHTASWALGWDEPGASRYLVLCWEEGRCVAESVRGPERPEADYVLTAGPQVWADLLAGEDTGRLVMYRRLRLVRGDVLHFFRAVYFVVETVAAIGRIPASLPTDPTPTTPG